MNPSWNNITVHQFQEVHRLSQDTQLDEMDKVTNTIGILFNKSEKEIDELPMEEFGKLARQCTFIFTNDIPGKPVKSIKVGSKKYALPYKPSALVYRQYVELISFSDNMIENMHNIMASLVQPVRFGFKRKNNVKDHPRISEDMREARLIDVYHFCVFFCKLFASSIEAIKGSLVAEMMKAGATKEQALILLNDSISAMGGFTQQSRLQNSRA